MNVDLIYKFFDKKSSDGVNKSKVISNQRRWDLPRIVKVSDRTQKNFASQLLGTLKNEKYTHLLIQYFGC